MRRLFPPLFALTIAGFACAPFLVARAPEEVTMGVVQKIFYFHVPVGWVMFLSTLVCGVASAIFLFGRRPRADAVAVAAGELAVLFGLCVLVTGPLWGRKAWGVWWQWDARLTTSLLLWLIMLSYLLVRRYGGPGSARLAAAIALFGAADMPVVYVSVNVWRTVHPKTTVVPSLGPGMFGAFWWCLVAFTGLYLLMLWQRARLETARAELERLQRSTDDLLEDA